MDMITEQDKIINAFEVLTKAAFENSKSHGFWEALEGADADQESLMLGGKVGLMHSELSEMLEALRHPEKPCEKIPEISNIAEEAADTVIRLLDFCGHMNIDLGYAIVKKMEYNASRPHKHGKTF